MRFSTVATSAILAASVSATPIVGHGHHLHKRAMVTDYVHVTKIVYENAHVYVDQNGSPVSTYYEFVSAGESEPAATSTIIVPSATSTPSTSTPTPSSTEAEPKSSYTSTVYVTQVQPSSTSTPPAPSTSTTSTTSTPPPPSTTSTTSTPPPPSTTSTTSTPPPPSTTSTPPPPSTTSSPSPSSTAEAAPTSGSGSGEFSGQATFYDVGLGACGITNTDADFIAALNAPMFGDYPNPNNNPNCGKKAQIFRNGKSVTVTITDKCPTCAYGNLDLSPAAFNEIADPAEGRVEITWSWVN